MRLSTLLMTLGPLAAVSAQSSSSSTWGKPFTPVPGTVSQATAAGTKTATGTAGAVTASSSSTGAGVPAVTGVRDVVGLGMVVMGGLAVFV